VPAKPIAESSYPDPLELLQASRRAPGVMNLGGLRFNISERVITEFLYLSLFRSSTHHPQVLAFQITFAS
jgi:hypothetical protein